MLTVEHLTYRYSRHGAPVLRGVDLTLESGEIGILLGCNGSGKTTLFKNLLGICTPDSGSIRFDGQELTALSRRRRAQYIAYVPQDIRFGELTVFDSVLLGRLSRFGLQAGPADRAAAARVLADMGLAPLAARSVAELSGGERQKVAIARALAQEPRLLVLDEPTAGLDPAGRENLMANIRDYHRNKGKTIILVSHSMDEIARNVDRILVLKNAHVLMQGTPAEVFARGEELLSAGLDVPQITRIAMELKRRGVDIDPAVYTVEALERQLLALRKGGTGC